MQDAPAPSEVPPADALRLGRRSDLGRLARGGLLNLAGALANGVFGFLLVIVVTRSLPGDRAGVFFEAVALFTIVSNTAELGADDGLVRMIPRYRALGRTMDLRAALAVGLWPVGLIGAAFGVLLFLYAPQLSHVFIHGRRHADALVPYIRIMAPFLPLSALSTTILSATRGFGTMVPFVAVDNVGKPALRPVLALAVIAAGLGSTALALSWAAPIVLGLAVAVLALRVWLRRAERGDPSGYPDRSGPRARRTTAEILGEFWRFAGPRAVSAIFSTTIFWLDTLLVGALRSAQQAGVYTAATRYLTVGFFALQAMQLITAPLISGLLAQGSPERAQVVYRVATQWLVAPSWPIYLTLALFAPLLLSVFGPGYSSGQTALLILSLALLVSTAAGPCLVVLLMGGHSGWTLLISMLSLGMNVGLNLLLIPRLGIDGAALAWAASIVFNNVAGMVVVARLMGLTPFGRGFPVVALAALVCFGALGLAIRVAFGPTPVALASFLVLASGTYLALLFLARRRLDFGVLVQALRLRNIRMSARAGRAD